MFRISRIKIKALQKVPDSRYDKSETFWYGLTVQSCKNNEQTFINMLYFEKKCLPILSCDKTRHRLAPTIAKYFSPTKMSSDFVFVVCIHEPRHDKTNKMSVRPAKTQISLGMRRSESSLCAQWVAKDPTFLHADNGD